MSNDVRRPARKRVHVAGGARRVAVRAGICVSNRPMTLAEAAPRLTARPPTSRRNHRTAA